MVKIKKVTTVSINWEEKIQKKIDSLREQHKQKEDFLLKLKKSFDIELTKKAELEGAIIALHEVLTGEKVEK